MPAPTITTSKCSICCVSALVIGGSHNLSRNSVRILDRAAGSIERTPGVGQYETLVAARKACRICVERSPGKIRSCGEFDFDPDVVSHWEAWLGHKRPTLLAVGQDFGNVGYFVRNGGRDDPDNQTNANLRKLLIEAGFTATDPAELDRDTPVFLTNSILCIKEGPMDGAIRS